MSLFLRSCIRWFAIISVLASAMIMGGCSAVRLGYNNAPDLTYWWLDSYLDFDTPQTLRVRADLQTWQDWHRKEELPQYAELLKGLQPLVNQTVSAEQVCSIYTTIETRLLVATGRILPTAAAVAPLLQPSQLVHLERTWEKRNQEWREDWLDGTPAERASDRLKKFVERAESFYGRLSDGQAERMRALLEASPLEANTLYRERLRRQQDTLQTLQALRSGNATEAQAQAELQALLNRSVHSPQPALRQYQDRMRQHTCQLLATLHNSATPTQRTKLSQVLQGYENDARALSAAR
ncbi:MAG TPA: DUF6279 family lipoprotein [Rhodoferax sp.]|nr:DUF6279 family lipoprotein [Rhodoferax sp.]